MVGNSFPIILISLYQFALLLTIASASILTFSLLRSGNNGLSVPPLNSTQENKQETTRECSRLFPFNIFIASSYVSRCLEYTLFGLSTFEKSQIYFTACMLKVIFPKSLGAWKLGAGVSEGLHWLNCSLILPPQRFRPIFHRSPSLGVLALNSPG